MSEPSETGTEQFSVLDATTGGKHIWHEEMEDADHVIFADRRKVPDGLEHQPSWECLPDVLCDFRRLPFADESFDLICFDPPHRVNDKGMDRLTGVVLKKYGALCAETWQADLHAGFDELWRVLRPGGTLTFKWADETKSHDEVLDQLEQTPHFGVTTEKKRAVVKWHVFHKPRKAAPQQPEEKPLVTDGGTEQPGSEREHRSELPGSGLLESTDLDFGGTTENVIEPVVVECPLASEGLTSYSVRIQYRAVEGEVPEIESLGAFVRAFEDVPATQEQLTEHVFETLSDEFGFASFSVEISGTHDGVATTTRRER